MIRGSLALASLLLVPAVLAVSEQEYPAFDEESAFGAPVQPCHHGAMDLVGSRSATVAGLVILRFTFRDLDDGTMTCWLAAGPVVAAPEGTVATSFSLTLGNFGLPYLTLDAIPSAGAGCGSISQGVVTSDGCFGEVVRQGNAIEWRFTASGTYTSAGNQVAYDLQGAPLAGTAAGSAFVGPRVLVDPQPFGFVV